MKRLLAVLLVVLMVFAVTPAFAQDEPGTIADIVVASTEAETPEFTVLLAAVAAADPSVLEALSNPDAAWTVFAPTDAAFAAALEAMGVTAEELLAQPDLLTTVLAYHVVPGIFDAETIVGLDGSLIGTLLPQSALAISVMDDAVMINDATVVAADVAASNGVIHVIDTVLLPTTEMIEAAAATPEATEEMAEPVSIAETVVAAAGADAPEFTTLLAAVSAADPGVLELLTNGGPYTVFAPTDEAFAALLEALGVTAEDLLANTDLLNTVLAYHVVPGTFSAETVVAAAGEEGFSVATIAGLPLTVAVMDGNVMINDATVIAADIAATNGVIHVIDTVLVPADEE